MSKLSFRQTVKAIARGSILAVFLALGCSPSLKAEEIKEDRSIQISENPFAIVYSDEADTNIIAQGRGGRKKKRKVEGYYGGINGGIGFPNGGIFIGDIKERIQNFYLLVNTAMALSLACIRRSKIF